MLSKAVRDTVWYYKISLVSDIGQHFIFYKNKTGISISL